MGRISLIYTKRLGGGRVVDERIAAYQHPRSRHDRTGVTKPTLAARRAKRRAQRKQARRQYG